MFNYSSIERKIDKKINKERTRLRRDYEDAIKVLVSDYNAELAFVVTDHAQDRISDRCESDRGEMSKKLRTFLKECSEDVLLEMVIAAQELGYFGVRTENIAFVFKGYYLSDESGKRVTLIKMVTCADEKLLGYGFHFKDVGVVLTKDTVTYIDTENPNE